jgi:LytS/YehU family sensor histidine kinase
MFFTFMLYNIAYFYIRNSIENQRIVAEKRYQKSQAELDVLKAQLNPHFFFNSLNNLYGTALQENAPKTVGLIEQLSSIMRYTMGEGQNAFTDAKNELDFIENYWALQEVRLPKKDTIRLSKQIIFDEKPTQIAPLLLIPFIENAFKYGISIDKMCKIDMDLSIENQQLKLILSNIIQEDKTLEKGNSIGIENTKKRLDLIYHNRYTLTQSQEANVYTVVLTIQLT